MARVTNAPLDAVIVGAGFAGIYALYALRKAGFSARVFERGGDVGGTWYWNRYPGARCDVASMAYSYSFDEDLEQEWHWPHHYAYQPDILSYAKHVVDRFDLRRDMVFNAAVRTAQYDPMSCTWTVETDCGTAQKARFVILATGCLSEPNVPNISSLDSFDGPTYFTAQWPQNGVDFTNQRVGVVGTGASGMQSIPHIARQAAHLTVFQRSANFSVPSHNAPMAPTYEAEIKSNYPDLRRTARQNMSADFNDVEGAPLADLSEADRQSQLQACWDQGGFAIQYAFFDLLTDAEANALASDFLKDKIRAVVKDPLVANSLTAQNHPMGTKRLCVDDGYFETFNRDNVSLIDLRDAPILRAVRDGLETRHGVHALDALVLATGFDAFTGAVCKIKISGQYGALLADQWAEHPDSYLGLMVAGFPNLFTVTGPGSPSVLTNMIVAIEQHVEWITKTLEHLRDHGYVEIAADRSAQDRWGALVRKLAARTLYPQAQSWYMGDNVAGKTRGFLPFVGGQGPYAAICDRVQAKGYEGFTLR